MSDTANAKRLYAIGAGTVAALLVFLFAMTMLMGSQAPAPVPQEKVFAPGPSRPYVAPAPVKQRKRDTLETSVTIPENHEVTQSVNVIPSTK